MRRKIAVSLIVLALVAGISFMAMRFHEKQMSGIKNEPLCATSDGPTLILPNATETGAAIHAGKQLLFLSFAGNRIDARIDLQQRFLTAIFSRDGTSLMYATSDNRGVQLTTVDVGDRKEHAVLYHVGYSPHVAAFTPDGKFLLGVTIKGDIVKINISEHKLDVLEHRGAGTQAIAISSLGDRLYLAGEGIVVVEIPQLNVATTWRREGLNLLYGIALSPNGKTLVVRSLHSLELFDAENGNKMDSIIVDESSDDLSRSLVNLVYSPDGSRFFYAMASYTQPELMVFSVTPLHLEKRAKLSALPTAISIEPSRHMVSVLTGAPGEEKVDIFEMSTLAPSINVSLIGSLAKESLRKQWQCTSASGFGR